MGSYDNKNSELSEQTQADLQEFAARRRHSAGLKILERFSRARNTGAISKGSVMFKQGNAIGEYEAFEASTSELNVLPGVMGGQVSDHDDIPNQQTYTRDQLTILANQGYAVAVVEEVFSQPIQVAENAADARRRYGLPE